MVLLNFDKYFRVVFFEGSMYIKNYKMQQI